MKQEYTKAQVYIFKNSPISFVVEGSCNVMINATEMAKPFGKKVEAFMRNEGTLWFVNEALKSENSRFLNINSQSDLYYSNQKSGTWMHRVLALKFAAWLNPAFELWVYATIEQLLFGKLLEREQSFKRTLKYQHEIDELKYKQIKTGEDFERYLELERALKNEKHIRKLLISDTVSGI